jgi:hypothetical protein
MSTTITLSPPASSQIGLCYYHESMGYIGRTNAQISADLQNIALVCKNLKVYLNPLPQNAGGVSHATALALVTTIVRLAKAQGFHVVWCENIDQGATLTDLTTNLTNPWSISTTLSATIPAGGTVTSISVNAPAQTIPSGSLLSVGNSDYTLMTTQAITSSGTFSVQSKAGPSSQISSGSSVSAYGYLWKWSDYATQVVADAASAQSAGADEFLVGNEIMGSGHYYGTDPGTGVATAIYTGANFPTNVSALVDSCRANFSGSIGYQELDTVYAMWTVGQAGTTAQLLHLDKIYFDLYEKWANFQFQSQTFASVFGSKVVVGEMSSIDVLGNIGYYAAYTENDWLRELLRRYDWLRQQGIPFYAFTYGDPSSASTGFGLRMNTTNNDNNTFHVAWQALRGKTNITYTQYFNDTFPPNDFTGGSGGSGGEIDVTSGAQTALAVAGAADFVFRGRLKFYPAVGATRLVARYTDSNNYYCLHVDAANNQVKFIRRQAGTETQLGSTVPWPPQGSFASNLSNSTYTQFDFEIRVAGSGPTTYVQAFFDTYKIVDQIDSGNTSLSSAHLGLLYISMQAGILDVVASSWEQYNPLSVPGSPYGVTMQPIKNSPAFINQQLLIDLQQWGINGQGPYIRNNYLWRTNETAPGVYNWSAYLDDFVAKCNAAGINIILAINGAPAWYLAYDASGNYIGPTTTTQQYAQNVGYSQINVNALPAGTTIPAGTQLLLDVEGNTETITTSAQVNAGATSIPINNQTFQYTHNSGVHVVAVSSVLPDSGALANYAQIVASRYNGQNGHGIIQVFQIGNEEYDSYPNPDPTGLRDQQSQRLALAIQAAVPAIRAVYPNAMILAGALRKTPSNAVQHYSNWLTNLCTYNGGVRGLISAIDTHYYRGGSIINGVPNPDPTAGDANTPDIATAIQTMQGILAQYSVQASVWVCEFGYDMYDDGNGEQTVTTAVLNAGQPGGYTSIPIEALSAYNSRQGSIPNATAVTIDYKNAIYAYQEIVYTYGQCSKTATAMQITTNPLGNGAPQAAWTPQYTHAQGCSIYAATTVPNIYSQSQVEGWTYSYLTKLRQYGAGKGLLYTDNPNSVVNATPNPVKATETKSLAQSEQGIYTYLLPFSDPTTGQGVKEFAALYPSWNIVSVLLPATSRRDGLVPATKRRDGLVPATKRRG